MVLATVVTWLGFTARELNATGLGLGFIGGVILALWGSAGWEVTPEGYMRSPGCRVREGEPGRARAVRMLKLRYLVLPRVGLALFAVAFLAQFLALWAAP